MERTWEPWAFWGEVVEQKSLDRWPRLPEFVQRNLSMRCETSLTEFMNDHPRGHHKKEDFLHLDLKVLKLFGYEGIIHVLACRWV